ncbi:hypothetical protein [Actinophytocola sp.]|uniref:hypothetical protein n=1 Tax=Actinophytocola sp. TaxID=1872138 RepID=UPI00389A1900
MRRRLKLASLIFDEVLLEAGMLRVSAGPGGASRFTSYSENLDSVRWQTPKERSVAMQSRFSVSIGDEDIPGVPAAQLREFINSESSISWDATLLPFAREFPTECGWVHFVRPAPPSDAKQLADEWSRVDKKNSSLKNAIPVDFVRSTVIGSANNDLALAALSGISMTADSLHQQVVAQRFRDGSGWQSRGFAMPILLPNIRDLPWESIVEIRKNRYMARFRAVMREIEGEVSETYKGGDVEDFVHRVFERKQAVLLGEVEGLGAGIRKAVYGLLFGGLSGVATMGIAGIGGLIAGTVAGTAIQSVFDVTGNVRQRRARGWLSVYNKLRVAG